MIIIVGSENPVKLAAVEAVFHPYGESSVDRHVIRGVPAKSGVREQPLSLDETIFGACQRARHALTLDKKAALAIGLESGVFTILIEIDDQRRMLDLCACAILKRDENQPSIGLSSAWEVPPTVASMLSPSDLPTLTVDSPMDMIDMDEAFFRAGLTKEKKIGRAHV